MPPIYEYRCTAKLCPYCDKPYQDQDAGVCCSETAVAHARLCGHEYEVLYTSFGAVERDERGEVCPKCGGSSKERLLTTSSSFILKGKGWFHNGGY